MLLIPKPRASGTPCMCPKKRHTPDWGPRSVGTVGSCRHGPQSGGGQFPISSISSRSRCCEQTWVKEDSPCSAFWNLPIYSPPSLLLYPMPSPFPDLPHHPRADPGLLTLSRLPPPHDVGTLLLRLLGSLEAGGPGCSSLPFCLCSSADFLLAEWPFDCLNEHSFPQGPGIPQKLRSLFCPP